MFNFIVPKDFKKLYNKDNDLITTFFQLYKTDFLKDEKAVNTADSNIHYKRDLISGDLRQLTIKVDDFSYSYTIAPKGKVIHFVVRVDESGIDDTLSGDISNNNKLNIRKFNPERAEGKSQNYYEKQVIDNLEKIFQAIYENS